MPMGQLRGYEWRMGCCAVKVQEHRAAGPLMVEDGGQVIW